MTLKNVILTGADFSSNDEIVKHKEWFDEFRNKYTFTEENTENILMEEIGKTFVRVLEDAGVYKVTPDGRDAFLKFTDYVNSK